MLELCSADATLRHVPMGSFETGPISTVGTKAWSDMFKALPDLRVGLGPLISEGDRVGAEVVIADRERGFELPQAYFLGIDPTRRITTVTVYWDDVNMGLQLTKAGAEWLVHAIKSLGKR